MKDIKGLILVLVICQIFLFTISFYEYYQEQTKLYFLINNLCFTYAIVMFIVLIKDKNQENEKGN
jgi:uncharacterized membrane protein